MTEAHPENSDTTEAQSTYREAIRAGQAGIERGEIEPRDSFARDQQTAICRSLVELLDSGALSAAERVQAGNILTRLGDPRFRMDAWSLPDEALLGFISIPEGTFMMGSDPQKDALAHYNEQPLHEVHLPAYYIQRYPVTVAQFRAFINACKYDDHHPDALTKPGNHPAAWVSWYHAMAYGTWLERVLKAWKQTPEPLTGLLRREGWHITLPSEAQWEKAARGGLTLREGQVNPEPQRIYPWGDEYDPQRANLGESGLDQSCPVGCFTVGASPYGVQEMSGNVNQWVTSLWGLDGRQCNFYYPYSDQAKEREDLRAEPEVNRILRGSSYFDDRVYARCANRSKELPDMCNSFIGFRVVLTPPSPCKD